MSVLGDVEIRELVRASLLIEPFEEHALQGGSYDMALGELMVIGGVPQTVLRAHGGHSLEPGGFSLVTTQERLRLPRDLIGHCGIMSGWGRRGLVSLFSPQIDPGFEGVLEVPIFNGGDADVRLLPGDQIVTVEFVRMSKPASFLWVERWGPKNPPSYPLPPKAIRPNLSDVEDLRVSQSRIEERLEVLREQLDLVRNSVSATDGQLRAHVGELRASLGALEKVITGTTARASLATSRWNLWVAVAATLLAATTIVLTVLLANR